jgi:hypothetical protein
LSGEVPPAMSPVARQVAGWWLASRLTLLLLFAGLFLLFPKGTIHAPFTISDARWYLQIARDGYTWNGDVTTKQSVAFFPLWPLFLVALESLGINAEWGGALLASLMLLGALLVLTRLLPADYTAREHHLFLFLVCCFPCAVYFSIPYTESCYLLCAGLVFLAWKRGLLLPALLASYACGLARPNGWLPGLAIAIAALVRARGNPLATWREGLVAAAGVAGFVTFFGYCAFDFGDFLAPVHAQQAWEVRAFELPRAIRLNLVGAHTTHALMHFRVLLDAFWMIGALIVACLGARDRRFSPELRTFALLGALFPVVMTGGEEVRSSIRYTMVVFPVWAMLASWGAARPWRTVLLAAVWLALFLFMSGRVYLGEWVQ